MLKEEFRSGSGREQADKYDKEGMDQLTPKAQFRKCLGFRDQVAE